MKPRQLQATVAWIILATLMIGIAFWQAQVAVARDAARRRSLPPPAKTRHAVRVPPAAISGDPVANYVARCEKGMTRQEIAWILEDYRNAGLDLDWNAPTVTE